MAQARVLLASLYEHVYETSQNVAKAEDLLRRTPKDSSPHRHHRQRVAAMRKDLREAKYLIDSLYSRYPATRGPQPPD
ncbi:hypothetical protein [Mycobacteroides franklinii]|uniref:hypothetical protein n=1 Tax=Mycobacteroides franklinii TaxID=948102 RepID=UPI0009F58FB2|nr:hypothetical protein [Mycobacteroides franklinii]